MKHRSRIVSLATVVTLLGLSVPVICSHHIDLLNELYALVDARDQSFLLDEIRRIQPAWSIRRFASFDNVQRAIGGGMDACIPAQLSNESELPLPFDEQGVLEVAVALARQRLVTRAALEELDVPLTFATGPPPLVAPTPSSSLHLTFDWAVPSAFLEALDDGEITAEEAAAIAGLPGNRELLRYHGRALSTTARMTEDHLVYFIDRAGSPHPLDRLWCWLNPLNDFGYADLTLHATEYETLLDDLRVHDQELSDAVAARIAPFLPAAHEMHESIAFTVGGPNPIWATSRMAGVHIGLARGDWDDLTQILTRAVFRRLQLQLCHTQEGQEAETIEDLATCCPEDPRYEDLHQLLTFAVLEGTADYAAGGSLRLAGSAEGERGADLIERYVSEVIEEAMRAPSEGILQEGLASSSPLPALGLQMAAIVADTDGPRAILDLQQEGIVAFIERVLEIESARGGDLLSADVGAAVHALSARVRRGPSEPPLHR